MTKPVATLLMLGALALASCSKTTGVTRSHHPGWFRTNPVEVDGPVAVLGRPGLLNRDEIRSLQVSSDSQFAYTTTDYGAEFWDLATGEQTDPDQHNQFLSSVHYFGRDGRTIQSWDTHKKGNFYKDEQLAAFELPEIPDAHSVTIDPLTHLALIGSDTQTVLFDLHKKDITHSWEHDSGTHIAGFSLSPTRDRILIQRHRSRITVRSLVDDGDPVRLSGGTGFTPWAEFSPDGKLVAGNCEVREGRITKSFFRIWDPTDGSVLFEEPGTFNGGSFSPDGTRLVVSDYGTIQEFDTGTWKRTKTIPVANEHIKPLRHTPDGQTLVVAHGRLLRLFSTSDWSERYEAIGHQSDISSVAFSPDGSLIATAGKDRKVILWDWPSGTIHHEFVFPRGCGQQTKGIQFTQDGNRLAVHVAHQKGRFHVYDLATKERIAQIGENFKIISMWSFTESEQRIIAEYADGSCVEWDLQTGLKHPLEATHVLTATPEGEKFAIENRKEERSPWNTLGLVQRSKQTVAISQNGQVLAHVNYGDINFYTKSGSIPAYRLIPRQKHIQAIALSPDGRHLVISGYCQATVWDISGLELIDLESTAANSP